MSVRLSGPSHLSFSVGVWFGDMGYAVGRRFGASFVCGHMLVMRRDEVGESGGGEMTFEKSGDEDHDRDMSEMGRKEGL